VEDKNTYIDRTHEFATLARRVARGEYLVPPTLLSPEERRLHVRQTLREDHHFRVKDDPHELQLKFDKMSTSAFVFFRGTALLYYRDLVGADAHLPWVLINGDVHPENFGVMPSEAGVPFFGLNDFDEAYFAPFTWDVRRGVVAFRLAAGESGLPAKKCAKVVKKFLEGYLEGLISFAESDSELEHQFRLENSPPVIKSLLEAATQKTRRQFLAKWVDVDQGRFKSGRDDLEPVSDEVPRFQNALEGYVRRDEGHKGRGFEHFKVLDVAKKKGSGTASLGFPRYYALVDGPSQELGDEVLLEIKLARRSVVTGLVPQREERLAEEASRVAQSHRIHLVGGDPYYGHVNLAGQSFLVRERSPFKKGIKLNKLDAKTFKAYAHVCGQVLAQAHARSDEDTGVGKGSVEHAILEAIDRDLFVDDLMRYAEEGTDRVRSDHAHYLADYALGAFRHVE